MNRKKKLKGKKKPSKNSASQVRLYKQEVQNGKKTSSTCQQRGVRAYLAIELDTLDRREREANVAETESGFKQRVFLSHKYG